MCRRKRRQDGGGCAALPRYVRITGKRVEKSVFEFEWKVEETNYAVMEQRLLEKISFEEDNLRIIG